MKCVWTYWEGEMPEIVQQSIASWKRWLPDWNIVILNPEALEAYDIIKSKSFHALSPTTKSDVIRLSLLYTHGGLWMDASILLLESFDWLPQNYPLFGFKLFNRSYIENWFLYAPEARHPFVGKWLQTLNSLLDTIPYDSHAAYAQPCTHDGNYFMAYQAYCHLVATDSDFAQTHHTTQFLPAFPQMYNPMIPLGSHHRLVKFTKLHRTLYCWLPFPILPLLCGGIVSAVIVAIVLLSKK